MKMKLWESDINVVLLGKVVESWTLDDASPNSLIDSIASPKMKTMEGKGVEVHSLVRSISGGEGRSGMGIRTSDKYVNYSHGFVQTTQEVGQ